MNTTSFPRDTLKPARPLARLSIGELLREVAQATPLALFIEALGQQPAGSAPHRDGATRLSTATR